MLKILTLFLITRSVVSSLSCDFIDTVNITGGYKDTDQNFIYKSDVYPVGTYQEFDYIENSEKINISVDPHIRGCICDLKPCIRLCCQGQVGNFPHCFETNVFKVINDDEEEETINVDDNKYGVLVGRPCVDLFDVDIDKPWKLQKNGTLQSADGNFDYNKFCFGISDESRAVPYACFDDEYDTSHQRHTTELIVHTIGMLISIPFLIITFLIYASIPELRNLHGKSLMCYILALVLVTSLLLYAKHSYIEKFEGIALYFSILLTFFWMNVLCFDIWSVARSRISNRSLRGEQRTFLKYCLYGFGCPLLITIIVVLIDHHRLSNSDYYPLFGDIGRMFSDKKTKAFYINIPIFIITLVNIAFFLDTSRRIWSAVNQAYDKKSEKRKEMFKKRFSTCLRLFIIMGVVWVMESIAFFSSDRYEETSFKHTIFQITDFINCIQGLLIFLVCISDERTRKLITRRFMCKLVLINFIKMEWTFLIAILIIFISRSVDAIMSCKFIESVNITGGYIDSNQNYVYKGDVYPPGTYQEFDYIEEVEQVKVNVDPHIRGCICKLKPCIRFCCHIHDNKCNIPDVFSVKNDNGDDFEINVNDNKFGIVIGRPCEKLYFLEPEEFQEDLWSIQNNGSINANNGSHDINNYCLSQNAESKTKVDARLCFHQDTDTKFQVHPIGMLISIPFLIITFLVYALIPELRNLHGKCLMCYTLSLTVLYAILSIIQMDKTHLLLQTFPCIASGYLLYFSVLLTFFWMNAMCYDIWKISSHGISSRSRKEEQNSFYLYCIYAFLTPVLITFVVFMIDHLEIFTTDYLPYFGIQRCYITALNKAEAIYVYLLISLIIVVNIIFFFDTARRIWKAQSLSNDDNIQQRRGILRNRFYIYLRLFILMGIMWCMESISWMYEGSSEIFYATDIFNCLQGVMIFIVCVCEKRTRNLIIKRWCPSCLSDDDDIAHTMDFGIHNEEMKVPRVK
ncbi:uncharacterized protein [Chironomus tepperi]|uniref:uncharacterized protein n=1 Tax=Chironomus tepperi TaxID=113505 RepID=UPI00391FBF31